jgi:uncharacterized metal-binding protein
MSKMPDYCPMAWGDAPGPLATEKLKEPQLLQIAQNAARVEAEGYCRWTRLEETMEFAKKNGWKKLGLAFCSGLRREGIVINDIFKANGFEVVSAVCGCGAIMKEDFGITDSEKVRPGTREKMCNPIGQAYVLAKEDTQFNVVVGLCVGHDSLFLMHSKAPATVLIAKDRVLAHNPAGAVYLSQGYYSKKVYAHPLEDK